MLAYGIYDLVDIAIWVAIIFYAYDAGGGGMAFGLAPLLLAAALARRRSARG